MPCEGGVTPFDISEIHKYQKKAFFCCALSIYFPNGKYRAFEGKIYGRILFPPKGKNGFGYDPIFEELSSKLTFAEMNNELKDLCSHRGKAVKKIIPQLLNIFA